MTAGREAAWMRLLIPGGALGACAMMDPHGRMPYWPCPFRLVTGLPCPLCGMTRAISSLLKFRWQEAIQYHALSPLYLGLLGGWLLLEAGAAAGLWKIPRFVTGSVFWATVGLLTFTHAALRWWGIIDSSSV